MAGELVSVGIQKLWDLMSQEYGIFQGVEDQVEDLKGDLDLLRSFLEDAGAKKHTSKVVKNFLEQIKEIIYDAEDEVETFLQMNKIEEPSGINNRTKILACILLKRRENALSMQGISTRISKVICKMEKFGVQKIVIGGMDSQPLQERQNDWRQEPSREYEREFVGLEANVKKLVGYLAEEDNVEVVSITGMGGLGKTTLARQAFNHERVKNKFDRLAWVCVSQVLNLKNVWQTILQNLTSKENKKEILEMTETTLKEEISRLLETSRSLIVFDDIWKEDHWEQIRKVFPSGKDWKVLLTSRNEIVTRRRNTINFKPTCLTTEESWTLFQMIASPRDDALKFMADEEMQEMGKHMIKHCGGLPLAVRVLGGLLGAKCTLHDWKRIYKNIGPHLLEIMDSNDGKNRSIYNVLSLSFEELPSNLKICFLYLAHFPEDYQISVEKLSYYWAAEGIFRYQDGETIRDGADVYIEELVRRNMVISQRDIYSLRFKQCHLHDMMREICLAKAKEENFLQIDGVRSPTGNYQSRRFVWQNPTRLDVKRHVNNPKLRSLLIVFACDEENWVLSGLNFKRLELLRVLDLFCAKFEGGKLPSGIGKLIHLRYLSLEYVKVSHDLPSSLGNLKLLIYLNLFIDGSDKIVVPNVLMGMKELRYLALPLFMHEKTKLELSNLEKLETLKNFSTKYCSLEDLRHMSRLRTIQITLTEEASIETLSASIGGLKHLEDLRIDGHGKIEAGFIVNFVHLKKLRLAVIPMRGLPKLFPSHLTAITLSGCSLKEDPMPILENLPQLKDVTVYNSFCGMRMVCSGGGFPQLQELHLGYMDELEEWIVEEGCMPLLRSLNINRCNKLKEFPDGLRYIISLKELCVINMGEEWEKRLTEGGEDYYKVQHIRSVRFTLEYPML